MKGPPSALNFALTGDFHVFLTCQRHAISRSTSSGRVAQLVAMRMIVCVSSVFSQKLISILSESAAACFFSRTTKIWLVGASQASRYPRS